MYVHKFRTYNNYVQHNYHLIRKLFASGFYNSLVYEEKTMFTTDEPVRIHYLSLHSCTPMIDLIQDGRRRAARTGWKQAHAHLRCTR